MKQTMGMMLATLTLLWSMNATAFDFGSMLKSGADLVKKGSELIDKKSASNKDSEKAVSEVTLPVYPGSVSDDCIMLTHDPVEKVVAWFEHKTGKKALPNGEDNIVTVVDGVKVAGGDGERLSVDARIKPAKQDQRDKSGKNFNTQVSYTHYFDHTVAPVTIHKDGFPECTYTTSDGRK